jgi:hypothetical protein
METAAVGSATVKGFLARETAVAERDVTAVSRVVWEETWRLVSKQYRAVHERAPRGFKLTSHVLRI